MGQVVLVRATLNKDRDGLNADFRLGGPVVDHTDLDFSDDRACVELEEHLMLEVASLVLDGLVVDFVLVSFLVDGPVHCRVVADWVVAA